MIGSKLLEEGPKATLLVFVDDATRILATELSEECFLAGNSNGIAEGFKASSSEKLSCNIGLILRIKISPTSLLVGDMGFSHSADLDDDYRVHPTRGLDLD